MEGDGETDGVLIGERDGEGDEIDVGATETLGVGDGEVSLNGILKKEFS